MMLWVNGFMVGFLMLTNVSFVPVTQPNESRTSGNIKFEMNHSQAKAAAHHISQRTHQYQHSAPINPNHLDSLVHLPTNNSHTRTHLHQIGVSLLRWPIDRSVVPALLTFSREDGFKLGRRHGMAVIVSKPTIFSPNYRIRLLLFMNSSTQ